MDPICLENCRDESSGNWKCPKCNKLLSRKQTLEGHLVKVHSVTVATAKRYKQYGPEDNAPKSTKYYRATRSQRTAAPSTCLNPEPGTPSTRATTSATGVPLDGELGGTTGTSLCFGFGATPSLGVQAVATTSGFNFDVGRRPLVTMPPTHAPPGLSHAEGVVRRPLVTMPPTHAPPGLSHADDVGSRPLVTMPPTHAPPGLSHAEDVGRRPLVTMPPTHAPPGLSHAEGVGRRPLVTMPPTHAPPGLSHADGVGRRPLVTMPPTHAPPGLSHAEDVGRRPLVTIPPPPPGLSHAEDVGKRPLVTMPPPRPGLSHAEEFCKGPGNVPLYNGGAAPLTQADHIALVAAFVARHHLSGVASQELLNILQLHLPAANMGERKMDRVKKLCGYERDRVTYFIYCSKCKHMFSEEEDCSQADCDGKKSDSTNGFATSCLKTQIRDILERRGVWESVESMRSGGQAETICDITSGARYKSLVEKGVIDNKTVTLSFFTDGVPLFSSSNTSLWPVYLVINELPPKERYQPKNVIVWGIWQGRGKPSMNAFLEMLVHDLKAIYDTGLEISLGESLAVRIKAILLTATMDLPARADVLCMTHHNGHQSCSFCLTTGERVAVGKGTTRSFPLRDGESLVPRTEESVEEDQEHALLDGQKHNGFLGKTVLKYLPHFQLTTSVVVDYMHGVLLGVAKKLVSLWFDNSHAKEPFSILSEVNKVNRKLLKLCPPYFIHRKPRAIGLAATWKASEYRNWLLFYSVPCLSGILPERHLDHFGMLVEAVYVLLGQGITQDALVHARELLHAFVLQFPTMYGQQYMGLNVHNLLHLCDCVQNMGPLWAYSAFPYESLNGKIKNAITGTGKGYQQVFWSLHAVKSVLSFQENLETESVKECIRDMLDTSKPPSGTAAFQCQVVAVSDVRQAFTAQQKQLLSDASLDDKESSYSRVGKVVKGGFSFYSKRACRGHKENSYTISFQAAGPHFAIEVEEYVLHKSTKKVFAFGEALDYAGSFLHRSCPHLVKAARNGLVVVGVHQLDQPLVVTLSHAGEVVVSQLPNCVECD